MHTTVIGLFLALWGQELDVPAKETPIKTTWSFNAMASGSPPSGFLAQSGLWKVVDSGRKKVLAQLGKNPDEVFNLILADSPKAKNFELSVKLRPIGGELDQGGGLVWRAKDANNYYVARYNPLEANFRVYKVENGKRTMFQNAHVALANDWLSLRVRMTCDQIECYLNGKLLLQARDSTFQEAGRIGLWSKADARTEFEDLSLEAH